MGYPYIGWFLRYDVAVYFFSYSGLVFDLVVGSLLAFDRTLWIGVAASLFFHGSNRYIFNIGIFPILCVASTTIFFASDWPLAVYYRVISFCMSFYLFSINHHIHHMMITTKILITKMIICMVVMMMLTMMMMMMIMMFMISASEAVYVQTISKYKVK